MNTSGKPSATRIITIACWIICAVVLIGLAVWIVTGNLFGIATDTSFFSWGLSIERLTGAYEEQGGYAISASGIDSISVSWDAGNVDVIPYEGSEIRVVEYAQRELKDDEVLYYAENNGTLTIKYRQGNGYVRMPEKRLELFIPYSLAEDIKNMNIDSTSGNINISDIKAGSLLADSTSGYVSIINVEAESIRSDTTSGGISMSNINTDSLSVDTISGSLTLRGVSAYKINVSSTSGKIDFQDTTADNVDVDTISGGTNIEGGFVSIRAESTSGSVKIKSVTAPESIRVDTISGSVTITIPETENLSVNFDSVSGRFSSDFSVSMGGGAKYNISTVSGSAKISVY